jgi:hypothetical protein
MMGFIKLDRQLFNHYIWEEKPFDKGRAWIDLIGLANHENKNFIANGTLIEGKRGNVYRSKTWLAERWGWSRKKVSNFLEMLAKDGMVSVSGIRMGTVNGTVITIVNYGKFQDVRTVKGAVKEPSKNGQGTVKEHIQEPNKEPNKEGRRNYMPSADFSDEITEDELQALYEQIRKEDPEYV